MTADAAHANFTTMVDSTAKDWGIIKGHFGEFMRALPNRVVAHLKLLDGDYGGYPVDRLQHSLQTATRALRDGADDELIAAALIHDIGDELAPYSHQDIAAAILRPYVRAEVTWIVQQRAHDVFLILPAPVGTGGGLQ